MEMEYGLHTCFNYTIKLILPQVRFYRFLTVFTAAILDLTCQLLSKSNFDARNEFLIPKNGIGHVSHMYIAKKYAKT